MHIDDKPLGMRPTICKYGLARLELLSRTADLLVAFGLIQKYINLNVLLLLTQIVKFCG